MVAWLVAIPARAVSIGAEHLPRIQSATFEVVAAKPTHDPLTYAKPLPMDLLPYQQRTDKYYSIGTAFALGHNRFVTAAHVLLTGSNSLWGPPALRDAAGHVYTIDKVWKFSMEKDFVVFSLVDPPHTGGLQVNRSPSLNTVVYAVGNALGTGVVIRDGLYTSLSPEQQDGRWKWMRFSAAASPGNSGGPLLGADGRVIGVVLAKSPNENLNYALPITDVLDAPAGVGEIDQRIGYGFSAFDAKRADHLQARMKLPMPLPAFFTTFQARFDAWCDGELKALLAQEAARTFPNGEGSEQVLHGVQSMSDFPSLIVRNSDGRWGLVGKATSRFQLEANGYLSGSTYDHNILFHLRRPDTVSADKLYGDPTEMARLIAQAGVLKRSIGTEQVRITGLGKPAREGVHVDRWKRRWQEREWLMPYANTRILVLALPTPDGYTGMMRFVPSRQMHDALINMRALTDFAYVNYDGTLAQWKDFLAHRALLPDRLRELSMDIDFGKRFRYASARMKLEVTPALQPVARDSMLTLGFSFFRDHGQAVWGLSDLWMASRSGEQNTLSVLRNVAPSAGLDDDYKNEWSKLLHRRHPYDSVSRLENDVSKITAVVGAPASQDPQLLYIAYVDREGQQPAGHMKELLQRLLGDLQVTESAGGGQHGAAASP